MNLHAKFDIALPLNEFLALYASPTDKKRWDSAANATVLSDAQKLLLCKFTRETHVLVLAGAWCGDCIAQCPCFDRFAEAADAYDTGLKRTRVTAF